MRKTKKYRKRNGTKKLKKQLHSILEFEDRFSIVYYNTEKNKNKN